MQRPGAYNNQLGQIDRWINLSIEVLSIKIFIKLFGTNCHQNLSIKFSIQLSIYPRLGNNKVIFIKVFINLSKKSWIKVSEVFVGIDYPNPLSASLKTFRHHFYTIWMRRIRISTPFSIKIGILQRKIALKNRGKSGSAQPEKSGFGAKSEPPYTFLFCSKI